ncbi:MAG: CDP-alcohol phosphatidyltransferase family protein [Wenzhouxiangella sp.]|nr:CDP-alcohol phosphatidyltransferase family protein [Wenzhouxiangella sp.]
MNLTWLPNALTVGRILAVPPLVFLLLTGSFPAALAVAVFAGLSDLLDGWLARRFDWQSRFGSLADPAADKLLMTASYLTLAWLNYLPWALVALVIFRDLVIVLGGWVYHRFFEPLKAEPTQLSRFNTFCQVFLMWYVLIYLAGFPLSPNGQVGLEWMVAVLAVATLAQYVWLWSLKAVAVARRRRGHGPR